MNLAKIRQKARNGRLLLISEERQPDTLNEISEAGDSPEICFLPDSLTFDRPVAVSSQSSVEEIPPYLPEPKRFTRCLDPVEAILDGRIASGCVLEQLPLSEEVTPVETVDYEEFLCIRISDELYGVDIMQIKEIIKPKAVTEVPRAPVFLPGVISLRGTIIPVIDMLCRLGFDSEPDINSQRIVVVRTGNGLSGLLVDEVTQVIRIVSDCIEPAPIVLEGINRDFINGIGRCDNRMIILLNLDNITDINLN